MRKKKEITSLPRVVRAQMYFNDLVLKNLGGKGILNDEERVELLETFIDKDELKENILMFAESVTKQADKLDGGMEAKASFVLDLFRDFQKQLEPLEYKENNKGCFKKGKHLVDQLCISHDPMNKNGLIDISKLSELDRTELEKSGEMNTIVHGIKLDQAEDKIVNALCKLYHSKGEIKEVREIGQETRREPRLGASIYEITKEYNGGRNPSGEEQNNVKKIIARLSNKMFYLKYDLVTFDKGKKGEKRTRTIEEYKPIISNLLYSDKIEKGNKVTVLAKRKLLIKLHPIFQEGIEKVFVLYPNDINERMKIAVGNAKIPQATVILKEYLFRLLSSNSKMNNEILLNKLMKRLAPNDMKNRNAKRALASTKQALIHMQNLGILKDYEIQTAKTSGEPKVILNLNKDFLTHKDEPIEI